MTDRKPVVLLPDNNLAELPAGDSLSWSLLSGVPVYATRWPTWDEVSGKPATFPPAAHTHTIADVSGLQSALDGKANSSHTHSASDITSGTLSDARLPSTMGGKTFTGAISAPSVTLGSQAIYLYESNSDGSFTVRTGPAGGPYGWFAFGADGNFRVLNDGAVYAQSFRNNSGAAGAKYFVGDDVTLNDVNVANTLAVVGVQDPNQGRVQLGQGGPALERSGTTIVNPTGSLDCQGSIGLRGAPQIVRIGHGNGSPDFSDNGGASYKKLVVASTTDTNRAYRIWSGTQAEYDAISPKNAQTLYFVV